MSDVADRVKKIVLDHLGVIEGGVGSKLAGLGLLRGADLTNANCQAHRVERGLDTSQGLANLEHAGVSGEWVGTGSQYAPATFPGAR